MEQMWKLNAFKMSFRSSKRALLVSCRKQTLLTILWINSHAHAFARISDVVC